MRHREKNIPFSVHNLTGVHTNRTQDDDDDVNNGLDDNGLSLI